MYKSKLQELCHQRSWSLPEYSTVRDGPDHNPRFTTTVTVNGVPFVTPDLSRSSKDAQNKAAKLAFDHLNVAPPKPQPQPQPQPPSRPSSFPSSSDFCMRASTEIALQPTIKEINQTPLVSENPFGVRDNKKPTGYSTSITDFGIRTSTEITSQPTNQEMKQTPLVNENAFGVEDNKKPTVVQHLYKSRLQNYAQKRNLPLPVYSSDREGPPHASRFRSKVTVDGKIYESLEFFPTVREAENSAAKLAYESVSLCEVQEDDSGLYKSLLQEFSQKKGFGLPKYETSVSGPPHMATFVSTVEIGGRTFQGQEAKSKKQAEMNAAKVAYNDLQERRASASPTILSSGYQLKEALNASSSILQSVISTSGFPQIVELKSNPMIQEAKDGNKVNSSSKTANMFNAEIRPSHPPIPYPDEEKDAKRNKSSASSSSDVMYAQLRDPFPALCGSPENGPSSPSLPLEVTANSAMGSSLTSDPQPGKSNFACRKDYVYPRKLNMPIPDGASVLPYSDDKWVAARIDPNQNQ